MAGIYVIDPDGKSGMLDDGTEFVAELLGKDVAPKNVCVGCIGEKDKDTCGNLPFCLSWDIDNTALDKSWIYKKKE